MKDCKQTEGQSVYEHGISVWEHTLKLINILKGIEVNDLKLPNWFFQYKEKILENLLSQEIIEEYTRNHDCGKFYCLQIDENGKRHFPDHANVSANVWLSAGGSAQAVNLMRLDMMCHTMRSKDVCEFVRLPEASTLLLVSLAEVISNAKLFGGFDSVGFKIKYKHLEKIGKKICQQLFENLNEKN